MSVIHLSSKILLRTENKGTKTVAMSLCGRVAYNTTKESKSRLGAKMETR